MNNDIWLPNFYLASPIFEPIAAIASHYAKQDNWPTLTQLNQDFAKNNLAITAVSQQYRPEQFDDFYESRIYLKGELQTRTKNWHDFFNAMVWLRFPHIKHSLNKLHYETSLNREPGSNRSSLENAMALFDECGMIIISDNFKLLELISNHQWQTLFIEHKNDFNKHIKCITFGHAMYEKALTPYIGMTAHCILLHSTELLNKNIEHIDKTIATMWKNNEIQTTRDLQAMPLLGIPAWYDQQSDDFYRNTDYFRKKPHNK